MSIRERIIHMGQLSDEEVLAGLNVAIGSSRQWLALVIAHLGEVEARRLHLLAGHASMFKYCTGPLGMSEDEACRRIAVARLARRFPTVLEALARGRVSLSVAASLESHLDEGNHAELLAAVSSKTVSEAREVLATWFPQPDVPASIRKLPERRVPTRSDGAHPPAATSLFESAGAHSGVDTRVAEARAAHPPMASEATGAPASVGLDTEGRQTRPPCARPSGAPPAIAPLSPERYRIQLTADAELKRKIELARDLLRHAVPSADLGTILGRALDLLIEKTLQRRFGQSQRKKAGRVSPRPPGAASSGATPVQPPPTQPHGPPPSPVKSADAPRDSRHLPSEVRRAVLERDGLRCTWHGPDGVQCDSRAWLEHDHVVPRGLGGNDDASNLRYLCRAHNRLAAEQAYGRHAIDRVLARQRSRRHPIAHDRPVSP
jgi:hypothetical protein